MRVLEHRGTCCGEGAQAVGGQAAEAGGPVGTTAGAGAAAAGRRALQGLQRRRAAAAAPQAQALLAGALSW